MAQISNNIEMWKKRLVAEMARDKKKAGILVVLTVAAIFFVGKLFIKSSPASATAMQTPAGMPQQDLGPQESSGPSAAAVVDLVAKSPVDKSSKGSPREITRDIFLADPTIFPVVVNDASPNGQPKVVDSEKDKADAAMKLKRDTVRQKGLKLQLESTVTGAGRVPIVIINGLVLGCGGVVEGFRVVKIESQTCVVEMDGVRLNLTMK